MWIQIHPGKAFDSAPPIFHIFQNARAECIDVESGKEGLW